MRPRSPAKPNKRIPNQLLCTMLIYFRAPLWLVRWFAFKASHKAPLLSMIVLIPLVWISLLLSTLFSLPLMMKDAFFGKPKEDAVLEALIDYDNGVPLDDIRCRLKYDDINIVEYELDLRERLGVKGT